MNQWREGTAIHHLDVTWSISIEEQFYVVWPLLLRLAPRRFVPLTFPSIVLESFLFRVVTRTHEFWGDFHSLSVASDFAVGGWLAYLMLNGGRALAFVQGLGRFQTTAIYGLGLMILLFRDFVFLDTIWPDVQLLGLSHSITARALPGICALPLSIAMALASWRAIERPFVGLKRRFQVIQSHP